MSLTQRFMAVMVSSVWVRILCIFCLIVVPEVWAKEYCTSYTDSQNKYHDLKECIWYCCGDCSNKYCCTKRNERFTEEQQANCQNWSSSIPGNITVVEIAVIVGGVILFITGLCLLICFLAPCCLFYKLCRKQPNQRRTANTAANMPQPHYSPSGSQAQPPVYQAVAGDEGPTVPTTPPPSYMESTSPSYPAPFVPGQEMCSLSSPNQPSAPPLPSDETELALHNPT